MDEKVKNNAFKTSLLFLGIIFVVIIVRMVVMDTEGTTQHNISAELESAVCDLGMFDCSQE